MFCAVVVALGFIVLFQSYYYFSPRVPCFQIPHRLGDLAQTVTPINYRRYIPGRH